MTQTSLPKLIAGSLLVGVSALSGTSLLATVAGGIGVNWASEALGGVLPTGLPPHQPESPLTAAYERALRKAVSQLRRRYRDEYGRNADVAAFALVDACVGSVAEAQSPAGGDLAAAQQTLVNALDALLHDHEERQVRWLKTRLLEQAAISFQDELAVDDRAWRLFHGWLIQIAAQHSASLTRMLVDLPAVLEQARDADAVRDALDETTERLERLVDSLRDELREIAAQPTKHQSGGVSFDSTTIGQMDDAVGGNKIVNNYYGSPDAPVSHDALLRTYLAGVISEANHLTLTEVDNADPEQREVQLEDVYTRLEVAMPVPQRETRERERRRLGERQATALEALAVHGRLVLLGPPGSGKSTLTRFLALCLARAAAGDLSWVARLGEGWTDRVVLPIRVELSAFAEWLAAQDPKTSAAPLLWEYLGVRERQPALGDLLRERAQRGEAILILDGLDEVPHGEGGTLLRRVREAIKALAALPTPRLILVTCRVLDYEEAARRLHDWPAETLIPFSPALQEEFIGNWYDTLRNLGRQVIGDYEVLKDKLRRAARERGDMRRLAGNPLLLTMMALLHASRGELPEHRVQLYAECLDLLLRRWRRRTDRPSLEEHLGLATWGRGDTDRLLSHLGYAAHDQEVLVLPEDGADGEAREGGALLTQDVLIREAAQVFRLFFTAQTPRPLDDDPYGPAGRFCHYVSRYSNGLLQCHGADAYRFPHRTFQEYLAARRLTDDRDWPKEEQNLVGRLAARAMSPRWHEVLLLAVSQLVVERGRTIEVAALARRLLTAHRRGTRAWAKGVVVAAEVLVEAGCANLQAVWEDALWDEVVATVVRLLAPPPAGKQVRPLLDAAWRVRAGTALGSMGDPRQGVCTFEPDWCVVPAGPFLLGNTKTDEQAYGDETPQRKVDLPAFHISRYLVTNAQWRRFVDAGGYQERRWWDKAGWSAKEQERWTRPQYWNEPRFSSPNLPVVGVSWYEAVAYCRWLSEQLGYAVLLPSEAEWEKAARGADGRIYPWGNTWDADCANTAEGNAGATTPVGCYPNGISPHGALDMSGNVFEWTATPWTDNYKRSDGTARQTEGSATFVRRGGAWSSDLEYTRCACRNLTFPSFRLSSLGLRVVAALPLTGE